MLCASHLRRICDDILGWSKLSVGLLALNKTDFYLPAQGEAVIKVDRLLPFLSSILQAEQMFDVEAMQKQYV